VKYRETIQDLLTRQYEGARVDEARQGSLVQVVDPAVVPDRPSYLFKIWIAVGAIVFCVPLALVAARAAESVSDVLHMRQSAGSWTQTLEDHWGRDSESDSSGGGQSVRAPLAAS
jgi:hypothetical protein